MRDSLISLKVAGDNDSVEAKGNDDDNLFAGTEMRDKGLGRSALRQLRTQTRTMSKRINVFTYLSNAK